MDKSENFDSNWDSGALPDLFEPLSQPKVKLLNYKMDNSADHKSIIFQNPPYQSALLD